MNIKYIKPSNSYFKRSHYFFIKVMYIQLKILYRSKAIYRPSIHWADEWFMPSETENSSKSGQILHNKLPLLEIHSYKYCMKLLKILFIIQWHKEPLTRLTNLKHTQLSPEQIPLNMIVICNYSKKAVFFDWTSLWWTKVQVDSDNWFIC